VGLLHRPFKLKGIKRVRCIPHETAIRPVKLLRSTCPMNTPFVAALNGVS